MKDNRASAFNYAFVAFAVMVAMYAIFSLFGGMPPLTVGGYEIETLLVKADTDVPISIIVPRIESTGLILIVPLCVFALRYVFVLFRASGLQVSSMWNNLGWMLLVTLCLVSGLYVMYSYGPLYSLIIVSILLLAFVCLYTVFNVIVGGLEVCLDSQALWLTGGLTILYGVSMVHVLIHIFFITLYRLEWLLFLPGIAIVLFVLATMLLTIVPCIYSIVDRLVVLISVLRDGDDRPGRILGY